MEKDKKIQDFTDVELLIEAKKIKSNSYIDAVLIGALIGIVLYSIFKNSFGFLMIIPILMAYFILKKSRKTQSELDSELIKRNLK